jgi:hypothetical protein
VCVETRTSGSKQVWELLHIACREPEATSLALVEAAELQLPQNSLTTAIDNAGIYYRVPIACINEPQTYNLNNPNDILKQKEPPKEKEVIVSIKF